MCACALQPRVNLDRMEAWQTAKHGVYGFLEKAATAQASVAAAREVDNTKKRKRAAQVVTLNKRLSKL